MTCKDCLYNKNCQFLSKHKTADVKGCTAFEDKSEWVHLPCRVGTVVYEVGTNGRIYGSTVRRIIYETPGVAFDDRAICKSVFLTLEEAEKALAERSVE
mgnify:CR=1 FL=1